MVDGYLLINYSLLSGLLVSRMVDGYFLIIYLFVVWSFIQCLGWYWIGFGVSDQTTSILCASVSIRSYTG
jgi:hypothetical protein